MLHLLLLHHDFTSLWLFLKWMQGITWSKLSDDGNGLPAVMIIFAVESVIFLLAAWYIEQVFPAGIGVPRHPLFFLGKRYLTDSEKDAKKSKSQKKKGNWMCCWRNKADGQKGMRMGSGGSPDEVSVDVEPSDVLQERERVERILNHEQPSEKPAILIHNLRKIYPGGKVAIRELALAVQQGECFGLLGPNGMISMS